MVRARQMAAVGFAAFLGAAPAAVFGQETAVGSGTDTGADLTTPEEFFGHRIGADYVLPNYTALSGYWETLAEQSPRMTLHSIGTTAEGRDQLMAIVTSPENHADLDRYRQISRRLALAEDVPTEEEARELAAEGRAVVWIDGGLHATEVLGAQQLMETLWQMVSGEDRETLRILDDVIILFVHANPDGMDLVSDWYMRAEDPRQRSSRGIPRLYQKYVGHDNNRDFYASTQAESENMNRVMYREWYPQIVYNHHQTGPTGTVMFAPPFRDPFNYNIDPMVITGIDLVGSAMHSRFVAEGKPGTTRRRGANYSTWWNGGLRTTPYFKNMIGLLTETIGNPTPMEIPLILERVLPNDNLPYPIEPQRWHFRQSVDYSVTANRAVLDVASRYRETFLYRIWRMGMNSIERGSRDSWTIEPRHVAALSERMNAGESETDFARNIGGFGGSRGTREDYETLFDADLRDPRGYIMPSDQPDFPTAVKFANALLEGGVAVHRATEAFEVNETSYPEGSLVVKTAQAFRPHVLDMFEPQDHPDDFPYPGASPTPPYDNAGWTLAIQMGVEFDRILDGFDGPFEQIAEWNAAPPPGLVADADGAAGFTFSHAPNDAFTAVNRLQAEGHEVLWLANNRFYVRPGASDGAASLGADVAEVAADLGLSFTGHADAPSTEGAKVLRTPRIALWDTYGGSMPSGWIRWILEQFEYADMDVVYAQQLNAGSLRDDYDVIIFPNGALGSQFSELLMGASESARQQAQWAFGGGAANAESIPEEYRDRLGRVTPAATTPALAEFMRAGGSVVTIGGSTALAGGLGLPVDNHLVSGNDPLPRSEYYVPGSILQITIDPTQPVTAGLPGTLAVSFNNSPVFKANQFLLDDRMTPLGGFASSTPLISGWAWGQEHLEGGVTLGRAAVGDGTLYLFGPLITRRAQTHATFKLLFNAIALSAWSSAEDATRAVSGG